MHVGMTGAGTGADHETSTGTGTTGEDVRPLPECVAMPAQMEFTRTLEPCFDGLCFEVLHADIPVSSVTSGDLDGDGHAELITAAGRGCEPSVTVWTRESDLVWRRGEQQASAQAGRTIFTLDADSDGALDVAVDLEVLAGNGAGALAPSNEPEHLDEPVTSVVRGRRGVYTLTYVGLHDHGDVPHGSFYQLHSFVDGELLAGPLLPSVDERPQALGPHDDLIGRSGWEGCRIVTIPEDWRGESTVLRSLGGLGCGGWTRLSETTAEAEDVVVAVEVGPDWESRIHALSVSGDGTLASASKELFSIAGRGAELYAANVDGDPRAELWVALAANDEWEPAVALATRSGDGWTVRTTPVELDIGRSAHEADFETDGWTELVWNDGGIQILRRRP